MKHESSFVRSDELFFDWRKSPQATMAPDLALVRGLGFKLLKADTLGGLRPTTEVKATYSRFASVA